MESIVKLIDQLKPDQSLLEFCKIQLFLSMEDIDSDYDWRLKLKVNIEYELAHDKLYHGQWNQVPIEYRRMFQVLSFLKAFTIVTDKEYREELDQLTEALNILDLGIIMGTGLDECQLLIEFAKLLHDIIVENFPPDPITMSPIISSFSDICDIDVQNQPSVEHFWTNYLHLHKPAKLTNCIDHWPAMTNWSDLNYFIKTAGYRTVPIELGKKYDSDDWSQGMFRLGEFLKEFMSLDSESSSPGYLAQHDLFDQIPHLRKDIVIPDYCAISRSEPIIKSWIGPKNTVSSMHTDDKHNLLCQVMGEKLVILAAPNEAKNLYTYDGLLNNTSQLNPESLNFSEFPLAKNVTFFKLTLKAGEMLYLPKLWFHHVRSLTPSISVSFWFDIEGEESGDEVHT